tara:strand:+ start:279 stop:482 length:204 start_codon:yes stop_codon:yes gene_type:complete
MVSKISIEENAKRNEIMNELYLLDERDKVGHPHRHTFTGLGQQIADYKEFARQLANFNKWNERNYPL